MTAADGLATEVAARGTPWGQATWSSVPIWSAVLVSVLALLLWASVKMTNERNTESDSSTSAAKEPTLL